MRLLHRDHDEAQDHDGREIREEASRPASDDRTEVVRTRSETAEGPAGKRRWAGAAAAHQRFGGMDLPATIAGTISGLGMLIVVGGLFAAAGNVAYEGGASGTELTAGSIAGGLVALFLAFLFGGWVAGRVARYDGARNGLLAGGWFVLLSAVLGGLGAWWGDRYDVFQEADLPSWFSGGELTGSETGEAIIVGAVAIAVVLLGGILGGLWGVRYHRRADAVVDGTEPLIDERQRDLELRDRDLADRDRDLRERDRDLRARGSEHAVPPGGAASAAAEPPPPPEPGATDRS